MPVMSRAVGREALLPERRPARLEEILRQYPALKQEGARKHSSGQDSSERENSGLNSTDSVLSINGIGCRIRSPKDSGRQKRCYSGKKKNRTVKNVLVTGLDR